VRRWDLVEILSAGKRGGRVWGSVVLGIGKEIRTCRIYWETLIHFFNRVYKFLWRVPLEFSNRLMVQNFTLPLRMRYLFVRMDCSEVCSNERVNFEVSFVCVVNTVEYDGLKSKWTAKILKKATRLSQPF
jgi:hypothetical protein